MFTGLGHRAISCRYYEDSAIHLSCTGDHVLYIVGMPWAVNMCIVTFFGFIFNGGGVDRDTTGSFFRSFINGSIVQEVCLAFFGQHFGDSSGQGCFTMIDMTDGANVNMRFCSFVMSFCHFFSLLIQKRICKNRFALYLLYIESQWYTRNEAQFYLHFHKNGMITCSPSAG